MLDFFLISSIYEVKGDIKMTHLKVLKAPDPRLKIVAKPVEEVNENIRKILADMLETMYAEDGIGLAATQVGIDKRLVVLDLKAGEPEVPPEPRYFINPEILWVSEETSVYREACLSVPEQRAEVTRPARIRIKYQDEQGQHQEEEADSILATCLQHEIDHLNGILYIDHLSRLKYEIIMKKLTRLKKIHPL
jgi:peptide deformylase